MYCSRCRRSITYIISLHILMHYIVSERLCSSDFCFRRSLDQPCMHFSQQVGFIFQNKSFKLWKYSQILFLRLSHVHNYVIGIKFLILPIWSYWLYLLLVVCYDKMCDHSNRVYFKKHHHNYIITILSHIITYTQPQHNYSCQDTSQKFYGIIFDSIVSFAIMLYIACTNY